VPFNPEAIIGHNQTSLAVADARNELHGDSPTVIREAEDMCFTPNAPITSAA
jgi:hypothetical protein